jgi:FAD:protein FMN transferase
MEPTLGTRLEWRASVIPSISYRFRKRHRDGVTARIGHLLEARSDHYSQILSAYDPNSELCRWRQAAEVGRTLEVHPVLAQLLDAADRWLRESKGVFNPRIGVAVDGWKAAAQEGQAPTDEWIERWVEMIEGPAFVVTGRSVRCIADCRNVTLNGIAKGFVAQQLVREAMTDLPVSGMTINLGGDICIRSFPTIVRLEHPSRPFDNEPSIASFHIDDGCVATSGSSRRPLVINDHAYSHLLDPRTCRPIASGTSATVVASLGHDADAASTVLAVTGELPLHSPAEAVLASSDGSVRYTPNIGARLLS